MTSLVEAKCRVCGNYVGYASSEDVSCRVCKSSKPFKKVPKNIPHECPLCGDCFVSKGLRKIHMAEKHQKKFINGGVIVTDYDAQIAALNAQEPQP